MTWTGIDAGRRDREALLRLLDRLAERVTVGAVDKLWVFPPRRSGRVESTVVVLSAFEDAGERRRVFTGRCITRRDVEAQQAESGGEITEHGAAPPHRIGRLIDGVLDRLEEDLPPDPPTAVRIGGDVKAWTDLLDDLASAPDIRYQ